MEIKKGKWYRRLNDVRSGLADSIVLYHANRVYKSERDGYITDEFGISRFWWGVEDNGFIPFRHNKRKSGRKIS